jgi:hypothetical protein
MDGLQTKPQSSRAAEEEFVYAEKAKPDSATAKSSPDPHHGSSKSKATIARVPLTTRLRADLAQALKRASLERQLAGIEPSHVQLILEDALEPWLRGNGYLA